MKETGERADIGGDGRNQHGGLSPEVTTLANLGVSRNESSKWQKLAAIPQADFEGLHRASNEQPRKDEYG
jgi:hypothetical protein